MPENQDQPKRFKVLVSEDRLKAWVKVLGTATPDFEPPTAVDVLAALKNARIEQNDDVRARVQEMVATITKACAEAKGQGPPKLPDGYLVAEGVEAEEGEDGKFEYAPALWEKIRKPDEHEQIDFFARNAIVTVAEGDVIGRVLPPKDGIVGVDVFGAKRPPKKAKGQAVKLGPGVQLAPNDPTTVVAGSAGRVAEENGKVRLYEVLDVQGDVDFSSGSIDAVVDVMVRGTVRANFKVRTRKGLTVDRVVEAAEVEAGGDITVRGGVFGREGQGFIHAGGAVAASFFNDTRVQAEGDVRFEKEILNSHVITRGTVKGERGTIIGGSVCAREGLEARVIGSDANVATAIVVGTDVNALRRARQMERKAKELRKSAEQIRQSIAPLMANLKRLLPEQRERVTELMCKADEVELHMSDLEEQRQKMLQTAAPRGKPSVLVNEALHPGTHLVIQAREVQFNKLLHGPVRIELRKVDNATQVVAVNQRTASVTVIPATDVDLDAPPDDTFEFKPLTGVQSNEPDQSTADRRPQ